MDKLGLEICIMALGISMVINVATIANYLEVNKKIYDLIDKISKEK